MNTQWMLETHGDPLGTVRRFVQAVWQQAKLDSMLVPLDGTKASSTKLRLVNDPEQLERVNPFKPLMTLNAAGLIPKLMQEHPEAYFGVMLRPCEMRALNEIIKYDSFELDQLLTICVDCLGTFPADEYQWWAARKGSADGLTHEALQFARQGGIVPYRYRSACQMCISPKARGADLNIGLLGLPVRQYLLVHAFDEATAERLNLDAITSSEATSALVTQRAQIVAKLIERHTRTRERVIDSLASTFPTTINDLTNLLEHCGTCQACLNVCPICQIACPQRGSDGRYMRDDLALWVTSCVGCGMCEQICPKHVLLSVMFGHLRERLTSEWRELVM